MFGIKSKIKTLRFKIQWRRLNKHNYTYAKNFFPINNVSVGNKTYGELNINLGTNPIRRISIGNYCSIASRFRILSEKSS